MKNHNLENLEKKKKKEFYDKVGNTCLNPNLPAKTKQKTIGIDLQ